MIEIGASGRLVRRGLALSSLALGIALATSAVGARVRPHPTPPTGRPDRPVLRTLALGDSYTIGEGVPEAARWPVRLLARLRAEGLALAEPEIVATTGWTTDELAAALTAAGPRGPYALVTLLIGVNDQYRGRPIAEYTPRFEALVRRAIELAGGDPGRVVVVSIPDWGVTPFAASSDRARIGAAIDEYNAANAGVATRLGVRRVDVTDLSRALGHDARFLAADGLHPSEAQYAAWVDRILPVARAALGRSRR